MAYHRIKGKVCRKCGAAEVFQDGDIAFCAQTGRISIAVWCENCNSNWSEIYSPEQK